MTPENVTYTKFPAKHKNFIGSDRLWTAADHLLVVSSTGISETYKRFYFKEIQALNTVKTVSNYVKLAITGLIFVLLCIMGAVSLTDPGSKGIGAVMAAVIGLPLLYYIIRMAVEGGSCRCYIYSSVQKEKLAPVDTVKKAERLLAFLLPEIRKHQGTVTASEIQTAAGGGASPGLADRQAAARRPPKPISTVWHKILFTGLILLAVTNICAIVFHNMPILLMNALVAFLTIAISVAAVVRQTNTRMRSGLKTLTITVLVVLVGHFVVGYVEHMLLFFKFPEKMIAASNNQWALIRIIAEINPFDYPVILSIESFFIIAFGAMGLAGHVLCARMET